MYEFDLILLLLQQMCVYLIIAWFLSKTPLFDAPRDKSPHIREINDTVAAFQYLQKNYNFMYQYQNSWSLKWVILAFEAIQSLVLTRD